MLCMVQFTWCFSPFECVRCAVVVVAVTVSASSKFHGLREAQLRATFSAQQLTGIGAVVQIH